MNYWKYREKTEEFYVYIGLMPPKELRTCKWVLHHKDIHLRETDYNRYRKYLINDVVPMTWSEHKQLHRDLEKLLNDTKKYGSEGEKHPMYGKHHSTETKDKISKSESGSNHWNWGKHQSDETRQKISNSQKGKVLSETHRKQISDKNSKCVLCVNTVTQEQLEFKNQSETINMSFSNFKDIPEGYILTNIRIPIPDANLSIFRRIGSDSVINQESGSFVFMANTEKNTLYNVKVAFAGVLSFTSKSLENNLSGQHLPLTYKDIQRIQKMVEEEFNTAAQDVMISDVVKQQFFNLVRYSFEQLL